jgi:hypothetical protein
MSDTMTWNSYRVTFVFDYTTISTCVFALHEDACESLAYDAIMEDLEIMSLTLDNAQEVMVELLDENVL